MPWNLTPKKKRDYFPKGPYTDEDVTRLLNKERTLTRVYRNLLHDAFDHIQQHGTFTAKPLQGLVKIYYINYLNKKINETSKSKGSLKNPGRDRKKS